MSTERTAASPSDRIGPVVARHRCAPTSVAEASAVMTASAANGEAVAFRGGGTKLTLGAPPKRLDTLIDTAGLSRIIEYVPSDLVVRAEAGVTLGTLQAHAARYGQRLALDAPCPERATLGGLVATADFGPRRARYGALRDLVLGLSLVRADGVVVKTGSKVVKNVAGFDLHKVLCGSLGSLGLIAEVTLRLHPMPESTKMVWLERLTGADLRALVRAAREAQLEPAAAIALGARVAALSLAIVFEGFERAVEQQAERLCALAARAGLAADVLDEAGAQRVFDRHAAARTASGLRLRLATTPSRLSELCAWLQPLVESTHEPELVWYPTLGLGFFAAGSGAELTPAQRASLGELRGRLVASGGSLVIEAAPWSLLDSLDPWGPVASGGSIMRELKQRFDPEQRLNPGRFVEGL